MRAIFHPEAHAEMIEQARYYENKSGGLGIDFLDAVEETVRRLTNSPKAGAIEAGSIRKRLVSGLSVHDSLRSSAGPYVHSRRDASTPPTRLLANAGQVSIFE